MSYHGGVGMFFLSVSETNMLTKLDQNKREINPVGNNFTRSRHWRTENNNCIQKPLVKNCLNEDKKIVYLFFSSSSSFRNFSTVFLRSTDPRLRLRDLCIGDFVVLLLLCLLYRLGDRERLFRLPGVGERLLRHLGEGERLFLLIKEFSTIRQ